MNYDPGQDKNNSTGADSGPRYTHQNWQQARPSATAAGPEPVKGRNVSPFGKRKATAVFPVLLSVLLTFALTAAGTWVLASQGVLPGTGRRGPNQNVPAGQETGDFGLSIHTDDPAAKLAAEKLGSMVNLLRDNYFKVLSPKEVLDAMTEGVANSMDSQYTYYMSTEDYQAFVESMQGNYSGIGATVTRLNDGTYQIISVIENGPAAKAGLQAQDIVLEVNGQSAADYPSTQELAGQVRGEQGTTVRILILRDGEEQLFEIVRGRVEVEHIQTRMMDDTVGYMHITEFASNLPPQFEAGLQELLDQGAEEIIFDMRGNPGGSADAVVAILDQLLPEGVIATTRGRADGEAVSESWMSDAEMMVPESMRYAILVNRYTASAAELFSGALRDYGEAVLIGETTFGKGSGTRTFVLKDGSAANITIFNYYLPKGDMIEGEGLTPEIPADSIDPEFLPIPQYQLTPEQDPALQEALDYFADAASPETP